MKVVWRGIDWSEVENIKGEPGREVLVIFKDGRQSEPLTHYPGEGTYQRALAELMQARKDG